MHGFPDEVVVRTALELAVRAPAVHNSQPWRFRVGHRTIDRHLVSTIPYHEVQRPPLELPPRPPSSGYQRPPREMQTAVPDHAATLTASR